MNWIIGGVVVLGATALALLARAAFGAPPSSVYVSGRVLRGPGGFSYYLTDEDLLWLARAVYGETRDRSRGAAAVIWAMAQHHATVIGPGGSRPKFQRLQDLLRAYCQPINPLWASADTSRCRSNPSLCTPAHIKRRRTITNASWEQIPAEVRQRVLEFAQGILPNPVPGLTDWAAFDWQSTSTVPLVQVAGNKFGIKNSLRLYQGR